MRYTRAQADRLAGTLHDLPAEPKRQFNRLQLVPCLSPQMIGFQERGYSLAVITAYFATGGFQIGEAAGRTYLVRTKDRGRRGRRGRSGARATTPAGKRHGAGVRNRFLRGDTHDDP